LFFFLIILDACFANNLYAAHLLSLILLFLKRLLAALKSERSAAISPNEECIDAWSVSKLRISEYIANDPE